MVDEADQAGEDDGGEGMPEELVCPEGAPEWLVTFGDLDDPTSVEEVDPDDLAATFGEGVSLKRITVQMTDDLVTTGIEERLGWLGKIREMNLSLEDFPEGFPVGDFSGLFRKDTIR